MCILAKIFRRHFPHMHEQKQNKTKPTQGGFVAYTLGKDVLI